MARGADEIHSLVADLVADRPTAVSALLEQHVDDGHGHCRTCPIGGQHGNQTWPCTIYAAAALAAERGSSAAGGLDALGATGCASGDHTAPPVACAVIDQRPRPVRR